MYSLSYFRFTYGMCAGDGWRTKSHRTRETHWPRYPGHLTAGSWPQGAPGIIHPCIHSFIISLTSVSWSIGNRKPATGGSSLHSSRYYLSMYLLIFSHRYTGHQRAGSWHRGLQVSFIHVCIHWLKQWNWLDESFVQYRDLLHSMLINCESLTFKDFLTKDTYIFTFIFHPWTGDKK